MDNEMITVLVPVYNSEKYVGKCIESIQAQTYPYWQLILVDDGSTDNSFEVCQCYACHDNRITVIHQENGGAGAARNAGLDKAIGKYVVFVDSDDYIDDEYFMLLSSHDEDVIFIDVQAVDDRGNVIRNEFMSKFKSLSKDDFMRSQMTGRINWGGCRKVVKRSVLDVNCIRYTSHKVGEEALFTYCSVFYSKSISFIEKPLYFYVQRMDSLSHTKMDDPWGSVAMALKDQVVSNGSYAAYADTINAFILTASAVSSDRLAVNYDKPGFMTKIRELYCSTVSNLDKRYTIDYRHMSLKAVGIGILLIYRQFNAIWLISRVKHLLVS